MLLILGKGFVGTFLFDECVNRKIQVAATTRDGRDGTIKFAFDLENPEIIADIASLPVSSAVVITFPVLDADSIKRLVGYYVETHKVNPKFILLGTTSCWQTCANRHSKFTPAPRNDAENWLLENMSYTNGSVLHLAGLWGNQRHPRNWLINKTKQELELKSSLHLIHGLDVARGIIAVAQSQVVGERWILTDLTSHDWYLLTMLLGNEEQKQWMMQIMDSKSIFTLPREKNELNRVLDSFEFWKTFNLVPLMIL